MSGGTRFQSQILLQLSRLARWPSGLARRWSSKRKGLHRSASLRSNSCTPTTRFQKFRGTEFRALGASVDDGPNVELSLTFSGAYLTLFIRRFRRGRGCEFVEARIISKRIEHWIEHRIGPPHDQLPSGVHFAPNKEQTKRTDNRHDETGGVI
jgi:hypothetical protein